MNPELKRRRLQTLARMFTGRNSLELCFKSNNALSNQLNISQPAGDDIFDLAGRSDEPWVLLKAKCAHESGYICFTDQTVWRTLAIQEALFVHIVKILEDARVMLAMANAFPGTLSWFRYLGKHVLLTASVPPPGVQGVLQALRIYALAGAIPSSYIDLKIKNLIKKCTEYVQQARLRKSTTGVIKDAAEIHKLIKAVLAEAVLPFPSLYELGTKNPEQAVNEGLDPWENSPESDIFPTEFKLTEQEQVAMNQEGLVEQENSSSGADEQNVTTDDVSNTAQEHPGEQAPLNLLGTTATSSVPGTSVEQAKEQADFNDGQTINWDEIQQDLGCDLHQGIKFKQEVLNANPVQYAKIMQAQAGVIQQMRDEIRAILEEYQHTFPRRGLKRGCLDVNALWKTVIPDLNIFYNHKNPAPPPNLAIYLLIDCSGSMVLPGEKGPAYSRIKMARSAAVVLHECCRDLKIMHQITGFTTDYPWNGTVIHYPVLRWAEDDGARIVALKAKAANRDGYSIRVATQELQHRVESQKILVVLSDGAPHCDGDPAYTETNNGPHDAALAVRQAEKAGIKVVGIYFGKVAKAGYARKIYNNFILCSQLENLPQTLARTIKKVL
ncbi:hypothetical protein M1N64_02155 [Peptococcaceae bacterium]|nr:hypothetical protein [Peptococcaceae bacterium]